MKCPRCQHENPQGARFCEECATPLTRTCANCGMALSATAKFCHACAHPVAAGAVTPSRSPDSYTPQHLAEKILTSKSALEGERKQVTVLFADLKGSMELLADRDPEEARKILDPVLERMMEAVHRYEGTVNQVMGDPLGDYRQAVALFRETVIALDDARVRARSGRPAGPVLQAGGWLARSLAELGEFPEAIRAGEAALRMVDSAASPFAVAQVHLGVGAALLLRGAFGEAVAQLEQGLALCELRELRIVFAATAAHLALAYARSGRLADSLRLLEREAVPANIAEYRAGGPRRLILLGEAGLLAGRGDEAAHLAAAALAWAREYRQRGDQALTLHLIGEIASRSEPSAPDQAGDSYREALALAGELGMRPLVAHCHLGLGKLYRRTGKREQAEEHLTTATTMYRDMGMTYWLQQAEAETRQLQFGS